MGKAQPKEKHPILVRDYITVCFSWLCILFCSRLLFLIHAHRTRLQKELAKSALNTEVARSDDHFAWLARMNTWNVVACTCTLWFLALCSDCGSWTYLVIRKQWDSIVISLDGNTALFEGTAMILLITVFVQRSYVSFRGSIYLPSSKVFCLMFIGLFLNGVSGLLLSVFTWGLQWNLVSLSQYLVAASLVITSVFATYFSVFPLYRISHNQGMQQLKHVCIRLSLVTAISLMVTSSVEILGAFTTANDREGTAHYIYYNLFTLKIWVNLAVLYVSLDIQAYYRWLGRVHEWILNLIGQSEIPMESGMSVRQKTDSEFHLPKPSVSIASTV